MSFMWSLGDDIPDLWILWKIKRRDEIANCHRTQKDLVREKLGITTGFSLRLELLLPWLP